MPCYFSGESETRWKKEDDYLMRNHPRAQPAWRLAPGLWRCLKKCREQKLSRVQFLRAPWVWRCGFLNCFMASAGLKSKERDVARSYD